MNYLILNGEFNNKGSEAMTLIAIGNIVKKDPESIIYLQDHHTEKAFSLIDNVKMLDCSLELMSIIRGRRLPLKRAIKEFVKIFVPGKKSLFGKKKRVLKVLKTIDTTIDISGYRLSSNWSDDFNVNYCDWIDTMKELNSKFFVMPQSFGPFDYNKPFLYGHVKQSLQKCDLIFAREKSGFDLLKSIGLNNIQYCYDSVLIEKEVKPCNVICNFDSFVENIQVSNPYSVAIVPNYRLVDKKGVSYETLIGFYSSVIKENKGIDFYLVSHAGEDLKINRDIKKEFINDDRVHFIDHVLLSFNFQELMRKMIFIIASRYHSIIHAFKECTPAIILGWSEKYDDIAELFEQKEYVIKPERDFSSIEIVNRMKNRYCEEKKVIKKHLDFVQTYNCYDFLR